VKKSQYEAAKALVLAGADVNSLDDEGTPLLHIAVNNGKTDMVQLLLDNNAKVKAKDKYGLTALVYALKGQHTEIVKLIKDAGGSY
jgi:ankyrin repeat protein